MLRAALWTLRQRRYQALAALMLVVALICIGAGTFEVTRFEQKVHENDVLTNQAHAPAVPLTTALVPLVGHGPAPGAYAIRYRTVTVSGTYAGTQEFLRNQSLNGADGYYVLTPLRTTSGVLLVVRGFVGAASDGSPPATVAPPPLGPVHVTGRLQTADTTNDGARELDGHQIASVNPSEQAARLDAPVYNAYLTLNAHQPGTSGVTALPAPDLSNPAGGAYDWQHFAYVIQWYVFALLALAAPFVVSRSEAQAARRRYLGIDSGGRQLGLEPGREAAPDPAAGESTGGEVAVRGRGALAARDAAAAQRWQRAVRLADRYGLSLGPDGPPPAGEASPSEYGSEPASAGVNQADLVRARGRSRYDDSFHDSYNDYLWQLAMADGATSTVSPERIQPADPSRGDADDASTAE